MPGCDNAIRRSSARCMKAMVDKPAGISTSHVSRASLSFRERDDLVGVNHARYRGDGIAAHYELTVCWRHGKQSAEDSRTIHEQRNSRPW